MGNKNDGRTITDHTITGQQQLGLQKKTKQIQSG